MAKKKNPLAIRGNPVGKSCSYKGHAAKIVKKHPLGKFTIRFNSTGSKKTVSARSLGGLAVRENPFMSFERHGGQADPVTFFAHTTRQRKPRTGTGAYSRRVGGKAKSLRGKKKGWRSESAMSGHRLIGRPASKAVTKAVQAKRQSAAWKKLPAATKKARIARLQAGHKRYLKSIGRR